MGVSCSSSEQKPSLRQRHSLHASNAESRIRLIVLLTAPKIFAISSRTDKNSCRSFARLSAWWFDWVGLPHPKRKLIRSVLINGLCLFGVSVRKANAKISAELDEMYERLRRVVAELAHKAWWHNKGTILVYASADFPSSSDV